MLNKNQIAYFAAAVETGSLSSAAEVSCVTVQAVSKGIYDLEKEVGVRLLERTNMGVHATLLGELVYKQAAPALTAFSDLEKLIVHYGDTSIRQEMVLAVSSFPEGRGRIFSSESFKLFEKQQSRVALQILSAAPAVCSSALLEGSAEMAIIFGPFDRVSFSVVHLADLKPTILVLKESAFAEKELIDPSAFAGLPVAFPGDCGFLFHELISACSKFGFHPAFEQIGSSKKDIQRFLERQGVLFVADDPLLPLRYPKAKLVRVDLPDIPINLVSRKKFANPAALLLEQFIKTSISLLLIGNSILVY